MRKKKYNNFVKESKLTLTPGMISKHTQNRMKKQAEINSFYLK